MEPIEKKDSRFVRIFTNDNFILSVICLFTILVIIQEFQIRHIALLVLNLSCTLIFLLEMVAKHIKLGFRGYWTNFQNIFDGLLVILAMSLIFSRLLSIMPDMSVFMVLRVLRVFRIFRILKAFKDLKVIGKNFVGAMRKCSGLFASFGIIILVIALLCCSLYKNEAPEYFGDPFAAIYTVFRLFTIEGWYEIPDTIATRVDGFAPSFARLFFATLLIFGGVIGMSLINSVFVDEMVSDNNDDLKEDISELKSQVADLNAKIDKLVQLQSKQLDD